MHGLVWRRWKMGDGPDIIECPAGTFTNDDWPLKIDYVRRWQADGIMVLVEQCFSFAD